MTDTQPKIILLSFLALMFFNVTAGDTPNAYTYFSLTNNVTDITFPIMVKTDPGVSSDVFWSNQFSFSNGQTSYIGMQRNGGGESQILWSVWNVSQYKQDGSQTSWCQKFGGEGTGISCRILYNWSEGHVYNFHIYKAPTVGWYSASFDDIDVAGKLIKRIKLGSIKINSDSIQEESIGWVEYFEWNSPRSRCGTHPYSQALFMKPYGHNAEGKIITARITGQKASTNCNASVEAVKNGGLETLGIGNSIRTQVSSEKFKNFCISSTTVLSDNAPVNLVVCKRNVNDLDQALSYGSKNKLYFAYNYCLDAQEDGQIVVRTCRKTPDQQWTLDSKGRITNVLYNKNIEARNNSLVLAKTENKPAQIFDIGHLSHRYKDGLFDKVTVINKGGYVLAVSYYGLDDNGNIVSKYISFPVLQKRDLIVSNDSKINLWAILGKSTSLIAKSGTITCYGTTIIGFKCVYN